MLSTFFPSLSPETFLRDHWLRDSPVVEHGDVRRFAEIADIPELGSLESLSRAHRWGTAATMRDTESNVLAIDDIAWKNAVQLYAAGATVHLNGINATLPALQSWCLQTCRELGLLPPFLRCTAFFAATGAGTPKHCDDKDTFIIQLVGEKRWTLAPNTELDRPIGSVWPWASGSGAEHLREMPEDRTEVVLRPGSVLFVPRGHWHATECLSDTVAITIGVQRPPRSHVLLAMLEEALAAEPAWREAVGSAWGTADQRQVEQSTFESLLQTLPDVLERLDFAGFCETQRAPEKLRSFEVKAIPADEPDVEFELDSEMEALVEWALSQKTFTLQEAAASARELSLEETEVAIDFLVEAGLIGETRDVASGDRPRLG